MPEITVIDVQQFLDFGGRVLPVGHVGLLDHHLAPLGFEGKAESISQTLPPLVVFLQHRGAAHSLADRAFGDGGGILFGRQGKPPQSGHVGLVAAEFTQQQG